MSFPAAYATRPLAEARPRWPLALAVAGSLVVAVGAVEAPVPTLGASVGLLFVFVTFQSLAAGLALFTILTFLNRIPNAGSGLTFVKLAGGVLVAAWIWQLARPETRTRALFRDHPAVSFAAVAFFAWTLLSLLWARDLGKAASLDFRLAQGLLLFFVGYSAIRERRHVWWLVAAFIAGAVLSAAIGLAGYTSPEQFDPATGVVSERLTGGIGDPNELAAILVPALTFALFALAAVRHWLLRVALLASAGVTAFALFRTESRGGLIALALTGIATIVFGGRLRLRALPAILLTAGAAVFYYVLIAPPEALARVTEFRAGGGSGRTDLWAVAASIFSHHPFAGVGIGSFPVVEPLYAASNLSLQRTDFIVDRTLVVHNTYLHVLTELGIIGFILFVALIAGALVVAVRAARSFARARDWQLDAVARGLVIGTIGMLGAFFFISAQYEKQLPLLLSVLVALTAVPPAEHRDAGRSPVGAG